MWGDSSGVLVTVDGANVYTIQSVRNGAVYGIDTLFL